ncbi:hypothetical protein [Halobaculum sp. D14]|uniref:hypothetical protein n=1 Tax=unclassified Halobaculum TaxID=2640896 RepID=UPI003EBFF547
MDRTPVSLPAAVLRQYRRFSLYNSPYPAHDRGRAVDLYPDGDVAASPVAGEVIDTRTVGCPDRPYAADSDHLILVDTGDRVARLLHVDPAVTAGDRVAVGDPLGELVRSGFFGQWVDNHLHLEFRDADRNPYRASGSLPLRAAVDVEPVAWDGAGTVVDVGPTHARLDAPGRPDTAEDSFAAVAADDGRPLDGGLPHYSAGGIFGDAESADDVSLFGRRVGDAAGRDVAWADVDVLANGDRVTGLSLFATREATVGAKLVTRPDAGDPTFRVGDEVTVTVRPSDDPVRLD